MISANELLAGIPPGLREPLIAEYSGLVNAYLEERWKTAGLDAGRFCEVAYTIIYGALSGTFTSEPSKPKDFPRACAALQSMKPVSVGDHSLRILLPRILPGIYDVRNNRDVGHVGGDVVSNKMDAEYVLAACTFILAELVRVFHNVAVGEAQTSVNALVERRTPLVWEFDGGKRVLAPDITVAEKTLLLAHLEPSWVPVESLISWTKYSNGSVYRSKVLGPLDKKVMLEFDAKGDRVQLTPLGRKYVEKNLLRE